MFILNQDYVLQRSIDWIKENSFTSLKPRRQYPSENMIDAGYANTPAQAESLLHRLEQAVEDIGHNRKTKKLSTYVSNKKKPSSL